jgi:DNA-binding transcriptional regulator/RsmH inhibitor MraZ
MAENSKKQECEMLPLNDDIFESGLYFGSYDPKIDEGGRLNLPKEMVDSLKENSVTELYRCPDPTGDRFILCPGPDWPTFVKVVKRQFAESQDYAEIVRLLCSGKPAGIDSQGRIRITTTCLDHAKTGPGQRVKVLGVGRWFEVSALRFQ